MGHEVITAIIRNGADVNHQNESGGTALQTACVCKADLKTIQAMIDLGADPLLGNANGHTPLIFAVRNRNPMETIAYLAQKIGPVGVNAQVHSGDAKYLGFTALHFAAQDLEPATCALLVKFGAKPGLPNHVGKTPLQLCMGDDNTRTAMRTAKPI